MAESRDITAQHARAAAELDADVALERIADVYAAALLGAGEKTCKTDEAMAELDALIDELFAQFPKLEAILASALVSHEEKCEILDRVLGGRGLPAFCEVSQGRVAARTARLHSRHSPPGLAPVRPPARAGPRETQHRFAGGRRLGGKTRPPDRRSRGRRAPAGAERRSEFDRRRRRPRRRRRARRLDRQPIAHHPSSDD